MKPLPFFISDNGSGNLDLPEDMRRQAAMTDYERGWRDWGEMVRLSPAPYHRRRLILQLARTLSFGSVLDAGCGNAQLLMEVRRRHPCARLTGIDLSHDTVDENRKAIPDVRFERIDLEKEALSESFDLVLCSEVVEHIGDWHRALLHLRRMCRGRLILTVPMGRVYPIDRNMGHHRHFSDGEMVSALREAGFEPEQVLRWGSPFHTMYRWWINRSPEASLRRYAAGRYTFASRILAEMVRLLFFFNRRHRGDQLIVLARAR